MISLRAAGSSSCKFTGEYCRKNTFELNVSSTVPYDIAFFHRIKQPVEPVAL